MVGGIGVSFRLYLFQRLLTTIAESGFTEAMTLHIKKSGLLLVPAPTLEFYVFSNILIFLLTMLFFF